MKAPTMLLGIGLLLLSACGSSDGQPLTSDDGGTTGSSAFASADGVISVVVPEGAAPSSFVGSVEPSDAASFGADLGPDAGVILVYDLGADGTTFSEPVTVKVRVSPGLGEFDPTAGLPVAILIIEDGNGGFERLKDSQASLDGETLVLEGSTTHFSKLVVHIGRNSIRLEVGEQYEKGEQFQAKLVLTGIRGTAQDPAWMKTSPGVVKYVSHDDKTADFRCEDVGTGLVKVFLGDMEPASQFLNAFFLTGSQLSIESILDADITCVEASGEGTATGSESPPANEGEVAIGEDPEGDGLTSDNSTQVTDDEDVPYADIRSVEHVVGSSGENCFIITVYGDGGEDVFRYSINVTAFDSVGGDWEARVEFEQGSTTSGKVFLRLREDGRTRLERLEGAEVSMEWLDSRTIKVTVAGVGTSLGVETFSVRTFGLNYYDDAEGAGAS